MNDNVNQIQEQKLKKLEQEKLQWESQVAQLLHLNRNQQRSQQLIEQFALNIIDLNSINDLPALLDDVLRGELGASWSLHVGLESLPAHLQGQIHFLSSQQCRRHLHQYFSHGQTEFHSLPDHTQIWLFGKKNVPFIKIIVLENLEEHGFLALGFPKPERVSSIEPFFRFMAKVLNQQLKKHLRGQRR